MASNCDNDSLESFTPFNVPADPDLLKDVARKELGETKELKEDCLKELRMLIKDNNVTCIDRDDFLLRFLRVKKFDVQRSFGMLQNYAKQRVAVQKYLQNLQPDMLKIILQNNIVSILPYRDSKGRLIAFLQMGTWHSDMCSVEDGIMTLLLLSYYMAERQSTQITGIVSVFDATIIPLELIPSVIRYVRLVSSVLLNGMPARHSSVHYVNESAMMKYFIQIINPFLPQKMRKRLFIHGKNREVLFQHLPPAILAEELGGSLGPMNNDHLIEEMINYLQKLKDEQRYFLEKNN